MAAATVALADRRQVHHLLRRPLRPRIRAHRHLGPEARLAQPDVVRRLRVQEVRNEFVVALEAGTRQIEEDHTRIVRRLVPDDPDGSQMPLV